MRKIEKRLDRTIKLARVLIARAHVLTLPYDARCKSRLATALDNGEDVALLMPRGTVLADGDMLVADDGGLVRIAAASEQLMRVRAANPGQLMRAAYHLGNRHTPVELGHDFLQLEIDPVLKQMLQGIGMQVEIVDAPFQPEPGAYGGGHRHGHDESFAEDYALAQQVYADHDPQHNDRHTHEHGHNHGQGQGHSHDHDHADDHEHDHGQGHTQLSSASLPEATPHRHGPHCRHDHGHEH